MPKHTLKLALRLAREGIGRREPGDTVRPPCRSAAGGVCAQSGVRTKLGRLPAIERARHAAAASWCTPRG